MALDRRARALIAFLVPCLACYREGSLVGHPPSLHFGTQVSQSLRTQVSRSPHAQGKSLTPYTFVRGLGLSSQHPSLLGACASLLYKASLEASPTPSCLLFGFTGSPPLAITDLAWSRKATTLVCPVSPAFPVTSPISLVTSPNFLVAFGFSRSPALANTGPAWSRVALPSSVGAFPPSHTCLDGLASPHFPLSYSRLATTLGKPSLAIDAPDTASPFQDARVSFLITHIAGSLSYRDDCPD